MGKYEYRVPKPADMLLRELAEAEEPGQLEVTELDRRKVFYEFMRRLSNTFYTVDDFKKFIDEETRIVLTYHI